MVPLLGALPSAPTRRANDGPGLATSTTKGPGADDRSRNSTNLRGARLGVSITHRERATMIEKHLVRWFFRHLAGKLDRKPFLPLVEVFGRCCMLSPIPVANGHRQRSAAVQTNRLAEYTA
jgi:hypothetical protein